MYILRYVFTGETDHELSDFVRGLYTDGEHRAAAAQLAAAIHWCLPPLPRPLRRSFPRTMASIDGWSRLGPAAPPWAKGPRA